MENSFQIKNEQYSTHYQDDVFERYAMLSPVVQVLLTSHRLPLFQKHTPGVTCLFSSDKTSGWSQSRTPATLRGRILIATFVNVSLLSQLRSKQTCRWLPLWLRLNVRHLNSELAPQRVLICMYMSKPRFFIRLIMNLNSFPRAAILYLPCLAGVLGSRVSYFRVPCCWVCLWAQL